MNAGEAPARRAAQEFVAELTRWRVIRGMSKKQLAAEMSFDASYVSHVEANRHRPTADFARRAESALQAGGAIWQRFEQYDRLRERSRTSGRGVSSSETWLPTGGGLVVDLEMARLSLDDGIYRVSMRRALYNAGPDPVTRYPIRIDVNRYPEDTERSNRHHRQFPLTWEGVKLTATCDGESMNIRPRVDRDAIKEAWLLFENDEGRFPLYPGQRATIAYRYEVDENRWGPWFQRAIRLPTRKVSVEVDFPASLRPLVWGVETSLSTESVPLRTPISHEYTADGRVVYRWQTDSPTTYTWYRLEWRFRGGWSLPPVESHSALCQDEHPAETGVDEPVIPAQTQVQESRRQHRPTGTPGMPATSGGRTEVEMLKDEGTSRKPTIPRQVSAEADARPDAKPEHRPDNTGERMRSAGIVQRGSSLLTTPVRRFDLPRQAGLAVSVIAQLVEALDLVDELHPFVKGVGLAAPQIGLDWAAAVVRPGGYGGDPITLLNPRILTQSEERDNQYEGCLSFFDHRGLVPRPLRITVERTLPTGQRAVEAYERATARLIAHEIDHLDGLLYIDRMPPGTELMPIEEYRETGRPWKY